MSLFSILSLRRLCAALLFVVILPAAACPPTQTPAGPETGFLLAAPDRGFMGNEEIRDLFDAFAKQHNAALLYVTDARTRDNAQAALATLKKRGAQRVVLLPLFYSEHEARYATLRTALAGAPALPLEWAQPFGASYFAVEALAERLRALPTEPGQRLIVAGSGAADQAGSERIAADLQRIAGHAAAGLGYRSITSVVWPESQAAAALQERAQAGLRAAGDAVVVQLHLAKKLDSMMAFSNTLKRALPAPERLLAEQSLTPLALTWMQREANRHLPLTPDQVGVVIAAHGSDWHWNETMRNSLSSLEQKYKVEYAFSMADAPLLERAVRRLDQRGARAIVIVRVFGMQSSFQREIEHLIGRDVEAGPAAHLHTAGDHGMQHGGQGGAPLARLRTAAVLSSAGGLDDHPLFAQALLARAQALSRDPKRETVILTAHGTGDEANNTQWLARLESIAGQMRANGGAAFRAIRVATWREDWPEQRAPWVERVRGWVAQAGRDGEAIVIPARTTGSGPEAELLAGLKFRLGSGFAPHPLFPVWVEQQVAQALQQPVAPALAATAAAGHDHHR
ncbi:MAG: cobalamin biosynthesis protein CbiX [Burkholderiales bacterium]|nr:cobalamin biosynthesis protein CbiX [Burkholderiales bacterium]